MRKRFRGKVLLIRRKYIVAAALTLAVLAIFYIVNHPAITGVSGRERVVPIYSVQREDRVMSLTFNVLDASDTFTLQVMQILNAYDVRASFFVTGEWVRENGGVAARLVGSGHELKNLSDGHTGLRRMSRSQIRESLEACSEAIEGIAGARPRVFRAPYGEYDDNLIRVARDLGLHTVQWSIDSGDWRGGRADAIIRQVQTRAFSGGIVLLHSNLEQTVEALPEIVTGLQADGFTLIPVSELMHQAEFTISITGRQIPV